MPLPISQRYECDLASARAANVRLGAALLSALGGYYPRHWGLAMAASEQETAHHAMERGCGVAPAAEEFVMAMKNCDATEESEEPWWVLLGHPIASTGRADVTCCRPIESTSPVGKGSPCPPRDRVCYIIDLSDAVTPPFLSKTLLQVRDEAMFKTPYVVATGVPSAIPHSTPTRDSHT